VVRRNDVGVMTSSTRVRLIVELDVDAERIAGSVALPGCSPVAFSGWMELMSILDAAHGQKEGS
jgi:hypothetical protein